MAAEYSLRSLTIPAETISYFFRLFPNRIELFFAYLLDLSDVYRYFLVIG
jgi:hypothetical protein